MVGGYDYITYIIRMVNTNICLLTCEAIPRLKAAGWTLDVREWGMRCSLRRPGLAVNLNLEYQDDLGSLVSRDTVAYMEKLGTLPVESMAFVGNA